MKIISKNLINFILIACFYLVYSSAYSINFQDALTQYNHIQFFQNLDHDLPDLYDIEEFQKNYALYQNGVEKYGKAPIDLQQALKARFIACMKDELAELSSSLKIKNRFYSILTGLGLLGSAAIIGKLAYDAPWGTATTPEGISPDARGIGVVFTAMASLCGAGFIFEGFYPARDIRNRIIALETNYKLVFNDEKTLSDLASQ
jgi:hypothetical protein